MPMDGSDWLKTQLTSFGCAACGQPYESTRIRLLAQRDGLYFVDLGCSHCGTQAVAIVTISSEDGDEPRIEAGEHAAVVASQVLTAPVPDPVSADDVLAIHQLLDGFRGGVEALLGRLDGSHTPESR
jgi:hypothetical protein